jgi:ribonuclease HI
MKYYAVKNGRKNGIYDNWPECEENVKGFYGAKFKSFSSLLDAKKYLEGEEEDELLDNTCFVDGSFDTKTNNYSFGCVIKINGEIKKFSHKFLSDNFSSFRNVAGEVRGASFIINYAYKNNIKELTIYYDYEGIEKWYTGAWKANNELTKAYQDFSKQMDGKIKIRFIHVKSHTNVYYNEMVDKLAKDALGI